jgi:hypothetical protein
MEARANGWDEIYLIYKALNDRQALVKTVAPIRLKGRTIDFTYAD